MLPCFAYVFVAAVMTIAAAGDSADSCFLEVVGYPATGETINVSAFDYAPKGTMRTIWAGGGALKLIASPTPDVDHYMGLPSVSDMQVAPLDVVTFVSIGQYVERNQSAWQLVSVTRYQSPGEVPGASQYLTITTNGQYQANIDARVIVLCDGGQHCIQQLDTHVNIDFTRGVGAGGSDELLGPGIWYLYVMEAPQGPSAIASRNPYEPKLPAPTNTQNNYSWFAPVGVMTVDGRGYIIAISKLPSR